MAKISVDVSDALIEDLTKISLENNLDLEELIIKCVQQVLDNENGVNNMSIVILDEKVMEKVNIKSKLAGKKPNEVVNEVLWDQLRKVEEIPDDFNGDEIWNKLEHDKPEGDDILDRITDMF